MQPTQSIQLSNPTASLCWQILDNQQIRWQHWGQNLHSTITGPRCEQFSQTLNCRVERTPSLGLSHAQGLGWMYRPTIQGHRAGGRDWVQQFAMQNYVQKDNSVVFTLRDEVAQLQLEIFYQLNEYGVLQTYSQLTNLGGDDFSLAWLAAACLPLPAHINRTKTWKGAWAGEFEPVEQIIGHGVWSKRNVRGRTSHDTQPSILCYSHTTTERSGEVFAIHIGHSGNFEILIEQLDNGSAQLQMGEFFMPGEMILKAGEIYQTPGVYAGYSSEGLNGVMQAFHATVRRVMNAPILPRQVHFNTWEAVYFDHEPNTMTRLIKAAAELGVERFVLDDGWFLNRIDDAAGLGDWWPDPVRYPNGLQPLFDQVRAAGMSCGLWFEPEMINANSELYRQHPDWVMALPFRDNPVGRNQLVLDITLPEVQDYLYEKISTILAAHPIEYVKWDMNRDLAPATRLSGQANYHAYTRSFYKLLKRLVEDFPNVEFESCSSGGGRIDYGVLPYVRRFWVSDCNDAVSRLRINQGFLQFFPPEYMGTHIGPAPAHTTYRSHDMSLRGMVSILGHMGLELDVLNLSEQTTKEVKHWIELYKKYRHVTHTGQVSQGGNHQHEWHLVVQPEAKQIQGLLAVFKNTRLVGELETPLRLLLPKGIWQVQLATEQPLLKSPPKWLFEPQVYSAEQLANIGLELSHMLPEVSLLFELKHITH